MTSPKPDISIIIPILNEASELPGLFNNLAGQRATDFEIILCDGGSTDGTHQLVTDLAEHAPFSVTVARAPQGRGAQMNAGAGIARSDLLLFLHVDSRFCDSEGLCRAVSAFRHEIGRSDDISAARFMVRFRRIGNDPSLAYTFYEAKARLKRCDCIRGDQGFLMSRTTFERLGRFETSLPFLEDLRLADAVERQGVWQLLPVEITTSARRFEQEGLYERQVVNAIIANAVAIGWGEFFTALSGLYRCASESGRIDLAPFLDGIRTLLAGQTTSWLRTFWRDTGRHVAQNAWQLFFWFDVRRTFKNGAGLGDVEPMWLNRYLRWLEPLFQSGFAGWLAQLLVRSWFRFMLFRGTSRTA